MGLLPVQLLNFGMVFLVQYSAAPKFWNGLPRSIRNANNLIKFKSLLKTYYFNVAYHN